LCISAGGEKYAKIKEMKKGVIVFVSVVVAIAILVAIAVIVSRFGKEVVTPEAPPPARVFDFDIEGLLEAVPPVPAQIKVISGNISSLNTSDKSFRANNYTILLTDETKISDIFIPGEEFDPDKTITLDKLRVGDLVEVKIKEDLRFDEEALRLTAESIQPFRF